MHILSKKSYLLLIFCFMLCTNLPKRAAGIGSKPSEPSMVPIRALIGHTDTIKCVIISPNSRTALSTATDDTLRLWNLENGNEMWAAALEPLGVNTLAISPDGKTAISGGYRTVVLWDMSTGKIIRSLRGHSDWVYGVAFSPDGRRIFTGGQDSTLRLWSANDGTLIRTMVQPNRIIHGIAFSPDGKAALWCGAGPNDVGEMKLLDLADGRELRSFGPLQQFNGFKGIAFSPNGQTILSTSEDKIVRLWDTSSGRVIKSFDQHLIGDVIPSFAFSNDGRMALLTGPDYSARLFDLITGTEMQAFLGHSGPVTALALSLDGRIAITGSVDATLKIWDTSTFFSIKSPLPTTEITN